MCWKLILQNQELRVFTMWIKQQNFQNQWVSTVNLPICQLSNLFPSFLAVICVYFYLILCLNWDRHSQRRCWSVPNLLFNQSTSTQPTLDSLAGFVLSEGSGATKVSADQLVFVDVLNSCLFVRLRSVIHVWVEPCSSQWQFLLSMSLYFNHLTEQSRVVNRKLYSNTLVLSNRSRYDWEWYDVPGSKNAQLWRLLMTLPKTVFQKCVCECSFLLLWYQLLHNCREFGILLVIWT